MKVRLIKQTSFSPEALSIIYAAFDDAWGEIEGNYAAGREAEYARNTLALAVLREAASQTQDDPTSIKKRALEAFAIKNARRSRRSRPPEIDRTTAIR